MVRQNGPRLLESIGRYDDVNKSSYRPPVSEAPATPPGTPMNKPPIALNIDCGDRGAIRRLLWFFALVYVVEGLAQPDGLIAQPTGGATAPARP